MRIGLALSGGGFRATLFHLGVVRQLHDARLLPSVSHVTAVSGGSVLAAHLVLNWDRYCGSSAEFDAASEEILRFVSLDVRNRIVRRYPWIVGAGLLRFLTHRRAARVLTRTRLLERHYRKFLFGNACLHQLPSSPQLHILSTNVSEGGLCSFTRDGLLVQRRLTSGRLGFRQYRAGLVKIATAVTASSAFPAFFPPLNLRAHDVGAADGAFPTLYLSDGGIFDNLGVRMFRYLEDEYETRIHLDDFLDLEAATEAWNRASTLGERTSVLRLREIAASLGERGEAAQSDLPLQAQELVDRLDLLEREGKLEQDAELMAMLRRTGGQEGRDGQDGRDGQETRDGQIGRDGKVGDEGREGQAPLPATSADSSPSNLTDNRRIIGAAFQQATGRECFREAVGLCDLILASDAGRGFTVYGQERTPGFLSTALRSSDILMDRVWQLERENSANTRHCVFASISEVLPEAVAPRALHPEIQAQLSRVRTDLDRFHTVEISGLIRHGYCVARNALRAVPREAAPDVPEGPEWDPRDPRKLDDSGGSPAESPNQGLHGEDVAITARKLQLASRRRIWSTIFDGRDWVTWAYAPLIVILAVMLPLFAFRTYRHARLDSALTRAVAEMREDFRRMLELLEFGSPAPFPSMPVVEVETLGPTLAESGLDIVSDNRITDLRAWIGRQGEKDRRVYVSRHVLVRKISATSTVSGLRLQSLWDSPDLLVRSRNADLEPVLQRSRPAGKEGTSAAYAWEIRLDFSDVRVGDTVEVVIDIMQVVRPSEAHLERKEWWRFEVDAQPEIATSWVLLPDGEPHSSFSVVRWRNETPQVVELVKPTHQTRMRGGAVIHWSVVHPEPGCTYSSRWGRE